MAYVCPDTCAALTPFTAYTPGCTTDQFIRQGGFGYILLLDCSSTVNSLTNCSQWNVLVDTGKLFVTPVGDGKLNKSNLTKENLDCFAPDVVTDKKGSFSWMTGRMNNTTYADYTLQEELETKYIGRSIMFLRCDGVLLHRRDYTTGTNPGFAQFSLEVNRESERDKPEKITVDGVINFGINNDFKGTPLSAACVSAITDADRS